jgi:hypothetical protein
MKILHLSNTPLSNSPANIASCQRHIGHQSRVLLHRKSTYNKTHRGGDAWPEMDEGEVEQILKDADLIHFHNFTWDQILFEERPHLLEIARKKPSVVQFHSDRNAGEDFESIIYDPRFKGRKLVIAQYHPRIYPEADHLVPNPLPLHEDRFRLLRRGKWGDCPPLTVSYAPSNIVCKGWDYKGHDQISPVLRRANQGGMTVDIITGVPYEDCLTRKSWSHIGIEEFFTGSYHLSFLEYMALQCAPIGYLDQQTKDAMAAVTSRFAVESLPLVTVRNAVELKDALSNFAQDPAWTRVCADAALTWMHVHWSVKATMSHYDRIYGTL